MHVRDRHPERDRMFISQIIGLIIGPDLTSRLYSKLRGFLLEDVLHSWAAIPQPIDTIMTAI
jgi:hypothetical protein